MRAIFGSVILLICTTMADVVFAQQPDTFHSRPLVNTYGAGVLTSSTKRANGDEILRIRATSETAQPFLKINLPPPDKRMYGSKPFPFSLEVGPPPVVQNKCVGIPSSKADWGVCFSTKAVQSADASWDVVELDPIASDLAQVGLRTKREPHVFAGCGLAVAYKALTSCYIFFEQAGLWHNLTTSPQALQDIRLFQCAAVQLRNAVWPDGPPTSDVCD